jgi:amidase
VTSEDTTSEDVKNKATASLDLAYAGVVRQGQLLRDGSLTAPALLELYLDRIERINPALNAFTQVRADAARQEANAAQEALDRGEGERRPLLGIPFAVKDEQDVAGCVTSWGTALGGPPASADGPLVERLRAAGAIVVGKTTMPELGMHPFTESPTWGATANPWDLSRTPGGSSGGSAAAVAAGLVSFATAADGGGSIRIPASCCNLFGLKLQRGRVEDDHRIIGRLSVPGVLTQRVIDAALLYDILAPGMNLEQATVTSPPPLRIGLTFRVGTPARVADSVRDGVARVASALRQLGHTVTPVDVRPGRWEVPFSTVGLGVLAEGAAAIEDPHGLEPRTQSALRLAGRVPKGAVRWALRKQEELSANPARLFEGVDLLLSPTLARPPAPIGRWAGEGLLRTGLAVASWCPFTSVWNFLGLPAAAIPAGFSPQGLPVGAQLLGPADGEPMLMQVAAQLEGILHWPERKPASAA